jgi:hypothetical protein
MSDQPRKAVPSWNAFFGAKKMFPDKLHLNLLAGNTQNGGGGTASACSWSGVIENGDRPLRRSTAVI